MSRRPWVIRPVALITATLLTALVGFGGWLPLVRPPILFGFLLICPGMGWVPLLRLQSLAAETTFALASSIAVWGLAANAMVYLLPWSPATALALLLLLTLAGAGAQLVWLRPDTFPERWLW